MLNTLQVCSSDRLQAVTRLPKAFSRPYSDKAMLIRETIVPASIHSLTTVRASPAMPLSPDSSYILPNKQDRQGPTMRSQDGADFLDNPFRSTISTIAFLGLCAFVVTSVYILNHKYRRARNYKSFTSQPRALPNLESARALSSGIDTGQSWTWQAESEIATADLVDMREGTISGDGEVSPVAMFPYEVAELDEKDMAEHELEVAMIRALQNGTTQDRYFTPTNTISNEGNDLWTNQKKAGDELDQVRGSLRSRMFIPNGVVVGRVGDSGIAQRRRTISKRDM
jgi:hypothetical protein